MGFEFPIHIQIENGETSLIPMNHTNSKDVEEEETRDKLARKMITDLTLMDDCDKLLLTL